MEWFKGVLPSQKPANQYLLGDIGRVDGDRHQGARSQEWPCRWAAGGIEQVCRRQTPNCPTVLHQAQQKRKRTWDSCDLKLSRLRSLTAQWCCNHFCFRKTAQGLLWTRRPLTSRRQPLLLHTNSVVRSIRFKAGPTEHLGELTGKAETFNFTQRRWCEANQWFYILNSGTTNNRETERNGPASRWVGEGKTRDQGYTRHTQDRACALLQSQPEYFCHKIVTLENLPNNLLHTYIHSYIHISIHPYIAVYIHTYIAVWYKVEK